LYLALNENGLSNPAKNAKFREMLEESEKEKRKKDFCSYNDFIKLTIKQFVLPVKQKSSGCFLTTIRERLEYYKMKRWNVT
jgi:hypothetical protein